MYLDRTSEAYKRAFEKGWRFKDLVVSKSGDTFELSVWFTDAHGRVGEFTFSLNEAETLKPLYTENIDIAGFIESLYS